jgi:pimeloyl-ACP methyl ester carboxylesterase
MHGHGPPLVRVATWLTHLEFDWESPVWRHWLDRLGERNTLVRYDERGCGLSDAGDSALSVDVWVSDLEAVVDAAGLDRFALLGISQGAAIAVEYAARHTQRVSDLVIYGGYARGRRVRGRGEQEEALVAAIRAGWTSEDPAFRRVFSMLFLPHETPTQMTWYDELLRRSTSPDEAVRLFRARGGVDVIATTPGVTARTLVLHARGDRVVPLEEGRLLASLIPGARLVVLDSANHILLAGEPGWQRFLDAVNDFLGSSTSPIYAKLRLSGKAARAAAAVSFIELSRGAAGEHSR